MYIDILKKLKKLIIILFPFVAFAQVNNAEIQAEFTKLINAHRAANGVAPLKTNSDAQKAALIQSDYLASTLHVENNKVKSKIGHLHPDFPNVTDRLAEVNPVTAEKFITGENAAVQLNPNIANMTSKEIAVLFFEQWKASPDHNKNMLLDDYTQYGLAVSVSQATSTYTFPGTGVVHTTTYVMYAGVTVFLWPLKTEGVEYSTTHKF
jgi:uncharacterized protein YkwD